MGRTCSKCGADLSRPKRRHYCRKKVHSLPGMKSRQITFLPRDMKPDGKSRSRRK